MRLGSSSMTSRSSSVAHRYRTLAPTSQVDETLFGSGKPVASRGDGNGNPASRAKDQPQESQNRVTGKDHIHQIKDPSGESIILSSAKFAQIASASHALTAQEKLAMKEAYQRKKDEELKIVEEKLRQFCEADQSLKGRKALNEFELEAKDRAERLAKRASELRMEQEEEIKTLNKLILGARCQATRDAQMQEKKQIRGELLEEEKRLDAMMEVERCKALEIEGQIDDLRHQQRLSATQEISDQIQKRLEEQIMQDEIKEIEKRLLCQKQEEMILEDRKALERKKEEQQRLQEEIMRINSENMQAKEQKKEQEKLADLRDTEFIRKKQEREAQYEAQQKLIQKEKELEIGRLRAQQKKAKDHKAEKDELLARRHQESVNREWRKKEKELAAKKVQEDALLKAAHLEQVQYKEHFLSIEAGREKAEFERVLKVQQEGIIKQKEQEEKQRHKALLHTEALRRQVEERELLSKNKRSEICAEADRLVEEARQRRMRLDEIKEKKLKELKETGLPEKYWGEVERKARAL